MFEAANVGDNQFNVVGELIEDYARPKRELIQNGGDVRADKRVPDYTQKGLTPGLWVEKPYATYGPVKMVGIDIPSE